MLPRSMPDAEIGGYCSRAWRGFRRLSAGKTVRIRPRRPDLESLEGRELLAGVVAEYPLASPPANPGAITAGPDGNLWFITDRATPGSFPATILAVSIGRITTAGVFTEFPITTPGAYPSDITSGPDGALWFTENTSSGPRIGRITTDGVITDFPAGSIYIIPGNERIGNITAGPDGALWFTETSSSDGSPFHVRGGIGRITTAGELSLFSIPSIPSDITAGPDGALWYTTLSGLSSPLKPTIGRITTAGVSTEFPIANYAGQITSGPDGALWYTEGSSSGPMIGRITTAGVLHRVPDRHAGRWIVRHHGRPGWGPLVHRVRGPTRSVGSPPRASSPSPRSPRPTASRPASRPARTATSGSPRAAPARSASSAR